MVKVDAGVNNRSYVRAALGSLENTFDDNDLLLLKKGAPDILLPNCSSALSPDGTVVPLDEEVCARITHLQELWASRGQRVLLLTRKIIKPGDGSIPAGMGFDHALFGDTIIEVAKQDLTAIGMVGIVVDQTFHGDNSRIHHVTTFLKSYKSVGELGFDSSWSQGTLLLLLAEIRDFPSTAAAIARQCGIIRNEKVDDYNDLSSGLSAPIKQYDPEDNKRICKSIVLSGKDLTEMKDGDWEQVIVLWHNLIAVMSVRRDRIRKDNARAKTADCEGIPEKE
jgi:sodium/potassium-transporting ATPase subunit alpha